MRRRSRCYFRPWVMVALVFVALLSVSSCRNPDRDGGRLSPPQGGGPLSPPEGGSLSPPAGGSLSAPDGVGQLSPPDGGTLSPAPDASTQAAPSKQPTPPAWGGRTRIGDPARGNLTTFLEEVTEDSQRDTTRRVVVDTHLCTVLVSGENLLHRSRQTHFDFFKDGVGYRGEPTRGNEITVITHGKKVTTKVSGMLARAGHSIPEEMESPWILDDESNFSLQEFVRHVYSAGLPKEPEAEPRTRPVILPAMRRVSNVSCQVVAAESLPLASGTTTATRITLSIDDPRRVQLSLWVDSGLRLVKAERKWGFGAHPHRGVAYEQRAHPGRIGAAVVLDEGRLVFRGYGESVASCVWFYADTQAGRRVRNRVLFEVAPQGIAIFPVIVPAEQTPPLPVFTSSIAAVLFGGAWERLAAIKGAGFEPDRVAVVEPVVPQEFKPDPMQAFVDALRSQPLLVIGGEQAEQGARAQIETLGRRLGAFERELLPGVGSDFRAANHKAEPGDIYVDPLPPEFVARFVRWLKTPRNSLELPSK